MLDGQLLLAGTAILGALLLVLRLGAALAPSGAAGPEVPTFWQTWATALETTPGHSMPRQSSPEAMAALGAARKEAAPPAAGPSAAVQTPLPATAARTTVVGLDPGPSLEPAAGPSVDPLANGPDPGATLPPELGKGVEPASGTGLTDLPALGPAALTSSPFLTKVALELKRRRLAQQQRAHDLDLREQALSALVERLDRQLTALKKLKAELIDLQSRLKAGADSRIGQLVKVYEAMRPKDAAAIFDTLDETTLLAIARRMRELKLAAILAAMSTPKARAVTEALATMPKLQ